MWEMHSPLDLDVGPLPDPPGGAGKIAEAIDRGDNGFFERRDMECRRQMGKMMLDVVKLAGKALPGELLGEELEERRAPRPVGETIAQERQARGAGDEVADLAQPVRAAVLIDGGMIDVGPGKPPPA